MVFSLLLIFMAFKNQLALSPDPTSSPTPDPTRSRTPDDENQDLTTTEIVLTVIASIAGPLIIVFIYWCMCRRLARRLKRVNSGQDTAPALVASESAPEPELEKGQELCEEKLQESDSASIQLAESSSKIGV
jgi:hypothetical protein